VARATIAAAAIRCCGVMTAATPPPAPALAPGVGIGIYGHLHRRMARPRRHRSTRRAHRRPLRRWRRRQLLQQDHRFPSCWLVQPPHQRRLGQRHGHGRDRQLPERAAAGGNRHTHHRNPAGHRVRRRCTSGSRPAAVPLRVDHRPTARWPSMRPHRRGNTQNSAIPAPVEKGDSGGPVYYRNADGTATPVGITIRAAPAEMVAPLPN
jgi:hypothetical protein